MGNLASLFKPANDEPDWDALRARSMYPELIGRTVEADDLTPFWMHCRCGMLVHTTRELAGQAVTCANCNTNSVAASHASVVPAPRAMSRRGESRMTFAVTVFVLVVGGAIGIRFMSAPPRAQAEPAPFVLD